MLHSFVKQINRLERCCLLMCNNVFTELAERIQRQLLNCVVDLSEEVCWCCNNFFRKQIQLEEISQQTNPQLLRSWLKVNSRRSKQTSILVFKLVDVGKFANTQNAFKQPEVAAKKKQRHFPPPTLFISLCSSALFFSRVDGRFSEKQKMIESSTSVRYRRYQ